MNIPNLPVDNIGTYTDDKGKTYPIELSESWTNFLNQLIKELQTNTSNEGLVAPTQSAANITTIQGNQLSNGQYTCQYGTIVYNSTAKSMMMAVDNGAGVPIFKTVTLV